MVYEQDELTLFWEDEQPMYYDEEEIIFRLKAGNPEAFIEALKALEKARVFVRLTGEDQIRKSPPFGAFDSTKGFLPKALKRNRQQRRIE